MITGEVLKFYSVKDVPANDFIRAYANYLKKNDKLELPKVLSNDFISLNSYIVVRLCENR